MTGMGMLTPLEVVKTLSKDDHKALLRLAGPLVERMPL